jgi:7-carboxy-7-deazaguanine synthase
MTKLAVSEVFGPTVQGEGPSIGLPATFLRLAGCNLACTWCDTAYTWDWKRYSRDEQVQVLNLADVAVLVEHHQAPGLRLVISGGEPMLQQRALYPLVWNHLPAHRIEVETAGTVAPEPAFADRVALFVVSPKLAHSGNPKELRYRPDALRALSQTGVAAWKFVCRGPVDFDEVASIVNGLNLVGPVYVKPEGTDHDTLLQRSRELVGPALERGWGISPRLHVDLWGSERGR